MRQIKLFYPVFIFTVLAIVISCSDKSTTPEDTVAPRVVSTFPTDSAQIKETYFIPYVVFSEPIKLDDQTLKVTETEDDRNVPGRTTQSKSGDSLFFRPENPFTPGNKYQMLLSGIKDDAGNIMPDYTFCWFVVAASAADTISPFVVNSFPADGTTGVSVNTAIYDQFSEPINPATLTPESYKLTKADGTPVSITVNYDPATFQVSMAHNGLEYATTYQVTLTNAITDTAGNHLVEISRQFTTKNAPDITPPEVISSVPPDGATGVAVDSTISDEFSEDLDPETVNAQSYQLLKDGVQVPATVSYANRKATLVPNSDLEYETTYEVVLTSAIADTAGNAFVGSTRIFTTENAPQTPWVVENAWRIKYLNFDEQSNLFFAAEKYDYDNGAYDTDAVLAGKFDQEGMLLWIKELPSAVGLADQPFGLAYADGSVYILRTQDQYGTGFGDIYIDKLDAATGDSIWTHFYGNGGPFDIDVYSSYVYLASDDKIIQANVSDGSIVNSVVNALNRSVVANENGVYIGAGNYTMYLRAYDHNLNQVWVRSYDTPLIETGGWVATYGNYVYMAGSSGDAIHGIPIDPVILKYDLQGNLQWDSTYADIHPPGNDYRRFITCDPSTGEVYMVGGPVKFSPQGEKLWQKNIEGFYAVYRDGVLYVVDAVHYNNRILRFDAQTGAEIQ